MTVKDWLKAIVSVGVLISVSLLMYLGTVPPDVGTPIIAALLGYVFGNSHGVIEAKQEMKRHG